VSAIAPEVIDFIVEPGIETALIGVAVIWSLWA
jgi:hypothetical protein